MSNRVIQKQWQHLANLFPVDISPKWPLRAYQTALEANLAGLEKRLSRYEKWLVHGVNDCLHNFKPDLLSQLRFRSILTNFATIFYFIFFGQSNL